MSVFHVDIDKLLGFGEYLLDDTCHLRRELRCPVERFVLDVLPVFGSAVKNDERCQVRPERFGQLYVVLSGNEQTYTSVWNLMSAIKE